jgi:hypothetical protein
MMRSEYSVSDVRLSALTVAPRLSSPVVSGAYLLLYSSTSLTPLAGIEGVDADVRAICLFSVAFAFLLEPEEK